MTTIHLTKDLAKVSLGLLFADGIAFAGNTGGGVKAGEIKACENTNGKLIGYCNKSEDG